MLLLLFITNIQFLYMLKENLFLFIELNFSDSALDK